MVKDFTQGKITPMLIRFTIPMVLGNLFQLTYNAVDSIIVGKFVGKDALAAVGICNPIMTLMILFLNGLCIGAGILMSNQYGSKNYDLLKRQISTTVISGIIFSIFLSLVCIILGKPILNIMQVDSSIYSLTLEYLRIIFIGLVFTFLYNCFTSILRALGDSKTPLYFLIISAIINIIGDLIFVVCFKMGSRGCAISTVLSEALCFVMCALYIHHKIPILRLGKDWFRFDKSLLKNTISYGSTTALQQATVQLGKLGIQALVNTMSVSVVAAFVCVNRIDDFAYTPEQNIAHSMTSIMAQNKGAGKNDRVKETFKAGIKIELIYGVIIMLVCLIFCKPLMSLFSSDSEVINEGCTYLRLISFMYILPAITNGVQGYFRGIGDLKITLISSFVNMGVRVLVAAPLILSLNLGISSLPLAYLCGWIGMLIVELPLLYKQLKLLKYAN